MIAIRLTLLLVLIVGPCMAGQPAPAAETRLSGTDPSPEQPAPKAFFPIKHYDFGSIDEGADIKYDFVIENQGDAPLVIKHIRPD
jgi:hypothetical protein